MPCSACFGTSPSPFAGLLPRCFAMNAPEKILSESAEADSAALAPFPASRKLYVEGSRPDIRVPMREVTLTDTPTGFGGEKNAPVLIYDTSGPYTDPAVKIDIRRGLPTVREQWI